MNDLKQMLSLQSRLARKSGANAMADLLGNSKREIERLESKVRQMSELCLTVEEVNSIKGDAVREAARSCGRYLKASALNGLYEYANKLERGD